MRAPEADPATASAEQSEREVDEVVPAVDGEDPEDVAGVAGDTGDTGLEAGAVEEADDPGDHEHPADERAIEPCGARAGHQRSTPCAGSERVELSSPWRTEASLIHTRPSVVGRCVRDEPEADTRSAAAPRRRGSDDPGRAQGRRRVRDPLRPPRRRRLLAGAPDRRRPVACRGRDPGGVHLGLAQRRPLRRRPRQRPLLDARDRSQPRDRRAAPIGAARLRSSTSTTTPCSRASPPTSSPTPRRSAARRRAGARRARRAPRGAVAR